MLKIKLFFCGLSLCLFIIACGTKEVLSPENENQPPKIFTLTINPEMVAEDSLAIFQCDAIDPEQQVLSYRWQIDVGDFIGEADEEVYWKAPSVGGNFELKVFVSDGENEVSKSKYIIVY